MNLRIVVTVFLFIPALLVQGQEKWTLEQCIDYALENNIALRRQAIATEQYRADYTAGKMQMLPSLNFQSQAAVNFGRSVDPVTNDITFNQTFGNYYYLGTGVTLFNGFATLNRMAAARYLYQMGVELQQQQRDLLSIDIINGFFQVLMARGVVETEGEQLKGTGEQLHRIEVMVETGGESRTTLLEMQSQYSSDKLLLTQAVNNEKIALESLRQLLQLEQGEAFDIDENSLLVDLPGEMSTDVDSVFDTARNIMPGIAALELKADARKHELKAAKGEATPEVSLSAGWRTGYYDAMIEGVQNTPFQEQIKNNNNQFVQANLTIPIFNRWYNGRNIKRAKLNLADSELELEQEINNLYSQVTAACLELTAVYDEYLAASDSREYSEIAYNAVDKKFITGMASATEYSEARRQKFSSEVNLLRTRLQYNLKAMTIEFYLTGRWM